MRTYDVTLTVSHDMAVWPGDVAPTLELKDSIAAGGTANTSQVTLSVHCGTHVDAPHHFMNDQRTVEGLSMDILVGRAYVLYLPDVDLITAAVLRSAEIPPRTRRLLFKTRNSEYWAKDVKQFQPNFVGISPDGAEFLVDRNVKLVGIDYLSVAPYKSSTPTHRILLGAGMIVLEGLNLSKVSQGRYTLHCLPLKLAGSDGAPARVILAGV
jgi:arylformamidase